MQNTGPEFSLEVIGATKNGGFQCNGTDELTEAELSLPEPDKIGFSGVKPGDTIEVHWVYTTCQVAPGPTLNSCFSETCANPTLRVEGQVFLVVNDDNAADFDQFAYNGNKVNGLYQPESLPTNTGTPIVFLGSTTGSSYSQAICSPLQVTWSMRPDCTKVSYSSIQNWGAKGNVFEEVQSHGARELVTAPELLAPID